MNIQPGLLTHYKFRKLVAMVGGDQAVLLALLRLWAHCQTSRVWEFKKLKRDDLAAICEWNFPNISCEKALVACGWIQKLHGGGYAVPGWAHHNKNLIANWNRNPDGKKRDDPEPDPVGPPVGDPTATPIEPNQTKPNQTLLEEQNQTQPDQPNQTGQDDVVGGVGGDSFSSGEEGFGSGGVGGSVGLENATASTFRKPSLEEVKHVLACENAQYAKLAERYYDHMEEVQWVDRDGERVKNWFKHSKAWCKGVMNNSGKRKGKKNYVP